MPEVCAGSEPNQDNQREQVTTKMWIAGTSLLVVWFILKFVFHKGGFVHMLLLGGISILVIQFVAYRKTRYQRD